MMNVVGESFSNLISSAKTQAVNPHPCVSIVVALHNMGDNGFLSELLSSFEAQTSKEAEFVIVDDCSTDDSLSIACEWARGRDDCTVIALSKNCKQGGARNHGFRAARGRYCAIVDADDMLSPNYVEAIAEAAKSRPSVIVPEFIQLTDEAGAPLAEPYANVRNSWILGETTPERRAELLINHWQFGIWDAELFKDPKNYFPEGMAYEDTPAGYRWLLQIKSVAVAQSCTYYYRQNMSSTTHTTHSDLQKLEDRIKSSYMIVENAKDLGMYDRYKNETEFYFLQVGYFNTLSMAAQGDAAMRKRALQLVKPMRKEFDLLHNPYYLECGFIKRMYRRMIWIAPGAFMTAKHVAHGLKPLKAVFKRLKQKMEN